MKDLNNMYKVKSLNLIAILSFTIFMLDDN